jgi:hypothetical protein
LEVYSVLPASGNRDAVNLFKQTRPHAIVRLEMGSSVQVAALLVVREEIGFFEGSGVRRAGAGNGEQGMETEIERLPNDSM